MLPSILEPPTAPPPDDLDDIGRAFFAALDRDGGPVFSVIATVLILILAGALVWWLRRESRREREQQRALNERHAAALAEAESRAEQRQSIRVRAHVPIALRHTSGPRRSVVERCETQNVSGPGVAYLSHRPPPPGAPLRFSLDLGGGTPVALRGVVTRVEPPSASGAPALVAVRLGPTATRESEHVARWVAQQQAREIHLARRGRACTLCGRPLADGAGETHSACAAAQAGEDVATSSERWPRASAAK